MQGLEHGSVELYSELGLCFLLDGELPQEIDGSVPIIADMGAEDGSACSYGHGWRSSRNFVVFVAVFSLFTGKQNTISMLRYSLANSPHQRNSSTASSSRS